MLSVRHCRRSRHAPPRRPEAFLEPVELAAALHRTSLRSKASGRETYHGARMIRLPFSSLPRAVASTWLPDRAIVAMPCFSSSSAEERFDEFSSSPPSLQSRFNSASAWRCSSLFMLNIVFTRFLRLVSRWRLPGARNKASGRLARTSSCNPSGGGLRLSIASQDRRGFRRARSSRIEVSVE